MKGFPVVFVLVLLLLGFLLNLLLKQDNEIRRLRTEKVSLAEQLQKSQAQTQFAISIGEECVVIAKRFKEQAEGK